MNKKLLIPIVGVLIVIILAVYFLVIARPKSGSQLPQTAGQKQIINALPFDHRAFVALIPHPTNRLLTVYFDKPGEGTNVSVEVEYLSGNSLKGGRTTVDLAKLPYSAAFLLGSCSSGGKCSFDTDITTGTIKTKLEIGSDLHLLRSLFTFVGVDESFTSDQKLSFKSSSKLSSPLIAAQTHGFIGELTEEVAAEPVVLTSASDDKITGTLTVYAPTASKLVIYDGTKYVPLTATLENDRFVVNINHTPWTQTAQIIRDDQQGDQETVSLNLVGPIVPIK